MWIGLFELNAWAFASLEWTRTVDWIFLPAGVRLLAVLLWDWPGVIGLWLGAIVTGIPMFGLASPRWLAAATVSAAAPYVAIALSRWLFDLQPTLQGLTPAALLKLSVVGAVTSVAMHSTLFWSWGQQHIAHSAVAMLVGDLSGTLIVLYVARALIGLGDRLLRRSDDCGYGVRQVMVCHSSFVVILTN